MTIANSSTLIQRLREADLRLGQGDGGGARQIYEAVAHDHPESYVALHRLGRVAEARAAATAAWSAGEANALAALVQLSSLDGDYPAGVRYWQEWIRTQHESLARWRVDPARLWTGQDRKGRLLFLDEAGAGDLVMFARFIRSLSSRFTVLVQCRSGLIPVMERIKGVKRVCAASESPPEHDYFLPTHGALFQGERDPGAFAADKPYIDADRGLASDWRRRLGPLPGKRVGLVWQGNKGAPKDAFRSIPPALLAPLRDVAGVSLVSLQHGPEGQAASVAALPLRAEMLHPDFPNWANGYTHAIAAMKNLDLVISVDTATVHMAGALGVPCWCLLPYVADWRWGMQGERTRWYPSVRLYRQTELGDWAGVIARVASDLALWTVAH